jgi:hypothetical protein
MKATADLRRREVKFSVGDQVLLSARHLNLRTVGPRKLLPKYVGPYTITALMGPAAVRLDLPNTLPVHPVFHVSLLKKYHAPAPLQHVPLPDAWDGTSPLLTVHSILDHKHERPSPGLPEELFFRVRWDGQSADQATWERASDMHGCDELIQMYWADQPDALPDPPPPPRRSARIAHRGVLTVSAQICLVQLSDGSRQVRCMPCAEAG